MASVDPRPLHAYTVTPSDMVTILGARRHPAIESKTGNGNQYLSVFTSTGFQDLKLEEYCEAVMTVKPDIAIPLADLSYSTRAPGVKRTRLMVKRTVEWVDSFFTKFNADNNTSNTSDIHIFAPLLPIEYASHCYWLKHLTEEHASKLSGLAIYNTNILDKLGEHPALETLPRLSLEIPASPHHVLKQIKMGVDIFTIPFINAISDAGIALTFVWPPPVVPDNGTLPLGVDMWSEHHQVSLKPLMENCTCYVCTKHHQAYLHHLLNAREMLGWTLLQIHNSHVMDRFFQGIRLAIADGSFEEKADNFTSGYEVELPKGTGERPRARGYHFKPEPGQQPKINKSSWGKFGDDSAPAVAGADDTFAAEVSGRAAMGQRAAAGAETPLVPETSAGFLDQDGFAKIEQRN